MRVKFFQNGLIGILMSVCMVFFVSCGDSGGSGGGSKRHEVSFSVGEGSGNAPATYDVEKGKKIYLPGQEGMIAPEGKAFSGWTTGGMFYARDAEYTVNEDVRFVAQWGTGNPNPNPTSNPLAGAWLSEDDGIILFFTNDGILYPVSVEWNLSNNNCKVTNTTGLSYMVSYGTSGMFWNYSIKNDTLTETASVIDTWKYVKMGAPTSQNSIVPFAGMWITNPNNHNSGGEGALLIGIPNGEYFTVLYGTTQQPRLATVNGNNTTGTVTLGGSPAPLTYTFVDKDGEKWLKMPWLTNTNATFKPISQAANPYQFTITKGGNPNPNPNPSPTIDPAIVGEWKWSSDLGDEWEGITIRNNGTLTIWGGYWNSWEGTVSYPNQNYNYTASGGELYINGLLYYYQLIGSTLWIDGTPYLRD